MKDARKKILLKSPRHAQCVNIDDVMLAVSPAVLKEPELDPVTEKRIIKKAKKELLAGCKFTPFMMMKIRKEIKNEAGT